MLSLGFPRYFIGGFPQGLIKDFQGIIAGISCKVYPGCPRLTGVFIQALRFPRCLGFFKSIIVYDFQGYDKGFMGYIFRLMRYFKGWKGRGRG